MPDMELLNMDLLSEDLAERTADDVLRLFCHRRVHWQGEDDLGRPELQVVVPFFEAAGR